MIYENYVSRELLIEESISGTRVCHCELIPSSFSENTFFEEASDTISENLEIEESRFVCNICEEYISDWESPRLHFDRSHRFVCAWCHCLMNDDGTTNEYIGYDTYEKYINHGICLSCKDKTQKGIEPLDY
jgi:hypothetical protein